MQIIYDTLKEEYLDSLTQLDNLCFTIPWSRKLFEDEMNNNNAFYLLAICDNQVVAYGGMTCVLDEGNITNIAVHPDYRNCKIGTEILGRLTDYAMEHNLSVMMLELRESNVKAFNLYKKFGFETVGRRRGYYSDNGEDAVLMTKFLV